MSRLDQGLVTLNHEDWLTLADLRWRIHDDIALITAGSQFCTPQYIIDMLISYRDWLDRVLFPQPEEMTA